jgi:hypothetical protein
MPLRVLLRGSGNGGGCSALYTLPITIGRSASPPTNETMTSIPMRGMN